MDWLWLKALASLLLILGLIVATLWIMKRFMTFTRPGAAAAVAMEVAGVLHLAPRRSVYAVKTGGQVILLGVAEHGVTYLTQLPDASFTPESIANVRTATQASSPLAAAFNGGASPFLTMLLERFKSTGTTSVSGSSTENAAPAMPPMAANEAPMIDAAPAAEATAPAVKKSRATGVRRKKAPTT